MNKQDIKINLPKEVSYILDNLHKQGYEAYVVGGCVRDAILGKEPHDWDICTSALPEETYQAFNKEHIIPTGMQHGTITIMKNNEGYEVTTFRTDGDYNDGRHPDSVEFVKQVEKDLARRDFTINAIAYSVETGIVDPFNGFEDLNNRKLQCVGNANNRFNEDALRIMRAIRFAAVYDLEIESKTAQAAKDLAPQLSKVSKERITDELMKLLSKANTPGQYLFEFKEILFNAIPEMKQCENFEQHTPWHQHDVLYHILETVDNVSQTNLSIENFTNVRLAALLHDVGKPNTFKMDSKGYGHFYNHEQESVDIAYQVFNNDLKLPTKTVQTVLSLIDKHDEPIVATEKSIKKMIHKIGLESMPLLLSLKEADLIAHGEQVKDMLQERLTMLNKCNNIFENLDMENTCVKISDLKINGNDLKNLGIKPGPEMGAILNQLLIEVLDEKLENDKYELIERVFEIQSEFKLNIEVNIQESELKENSEETIDDSHISL